jgi:phosphopantothenoylcysteine decarboxylase / phosphopantothenate---cysteine ligase
VTDALPPTGARVVLGVAGGIAAYKACEVLRGLTEAGHDVRVVPTEAALQFVGAATWAALSGHPVTTSVWSQVHQVPHVELGRTADLVAVVPATADLMARAAHGLADDLLTSTLLTATCPVVFVPAMHTEMWQHPATRENVATLRRRGAVVVDPATGRLTGPDSGQGRLPDPGAVLGLLRRVLARAGQGGTGVPADLAGRRVVVSAGGTRESVDPVRFLGNRSSGRQGYALAEAAAARGAEVVLVAANVALPDPAGAEMVKVGTALELGAAVRAAAASADVVVMAAAVADFRPADPAVVKIKKSRGEPDPIRLTRNPDVLAGLVADPPRPGQLVVGFAAETGDAGTGWLELGRAKLAAKGCDLLVVNRVGEGLAFEVADNAAVVLAADGTETHVPFGPKEDLADTVWDLVVERLPARV